ncbi:MAG TPA: DUF2283 domain-containing protein [Gemmatimonadales bacterium]|nr:DUF2283 domain-containing protein [Gemmatimonadales bacterium]
MATFLDALSNDATEHGSQWENVHIFDQLESMAAWLRDRRPADAMHALTLDFDPRGRLVGIEVWAAERVLPKVLLDKARGLTADLERSGPADRRRMGGGLRGAGAGRLRGAGSG